MCNHLFCRFEKSRVKEIGGKVQETQNFEKHACQHTAAMETTNYLDQDMSYIC